MPLGYHYASYSMGLVSVYSVVGERSYLYWAGCSFNDHPLTITPGSANLWILKGSALLLTPCLVLITISTNPIIYHRVILDVSFVCNTIAPGVRF